MKLKWSEVTPEPVYLTRRALIAAGMASIAAPAFGLTGKPSALSTDEKPNSFEEITNYNNFYEFGTDKTDPARYSATLKPAPWSVKIDGLVDHPGNYAVEDLAPDSALEERIYRLRCVEAWSMVIPWLGVPLAAVLQKAAPQAGAKYVAFQTLEDPKQMPGQAYSSGIDWPYREGLRLDEAMNPLTILATGLYGKVLPNQNGAPIRLVVPWKYGFKSIKSIVGITLTDKQPQTTWQMLQANEYGFYANVNPQVDHPRWSQATERRIGAGLLGGRQETLMFNGYGDQVAQMYSGMDLAKNY
ncbi:protein-methionine-sulfoxide reductase catalytic subunit MsrP [Paracoccus litorisediminis]|uniref:Protein-methionine-sulfoxide reductase catalytic subunit MsrP n=1 Tax=Paracoccus litorisediminis TaxID=2006130 RepID=A0A844HLP4_9RHOB|nr:protein-methionine-sulfoxide reductase catalytic subunit MsrP [Paracoccus litorisediminis]MTH59297.1 protein-methionine-sulfoxide reductase catalytic subunit MsrP [Paracoccus litorisediminis]